MYIIRVSFESDSSGLYTFLQIIEINVEFRGCPGILSTWSNKMSLPPGMFQIFYFQWLKNEIVPPFPEFYNVPPPLSRAMDIRPGKNA